MTTVPLQKKKKYFVCFSDIASLLSYILWETSCSVISTVQWSCFSGEGHKYIHQVVKICGQISRKLEDFKYTLEHSVRYMGDTVKPQSNAWENQGINLLVFLKVKKKKKNLNWSHRMKLISREGQHLGA